MNPAPTVHRATIGTGRRVLRQSPACALKSGQTRGSAPTLAEVNHIDLIASSYKTATARTYS